MMESLALQSLALQLRECLAMPVVPECLAMLVVPECLGPGCQQP